MGQLPLFDRGFGSLCEGCDWFDDCGGAATDFACSPWRGIVEPGGESVLHPTQARTSHYLAAVGGPSFNVPILRQALPALPPYLPQVRRRSALHGWLNERIYAVRAKDVVGERAHVLRAAEFRETVGLSADQQLVLLLFDRDPILERLWEQSTRLLPEIAEAEYDAVVAPSYSIWLPRPRTEFLYNVKRSIVIFRALQQMKVPVIPRMAWVIEHDVRRFAEWAADPALEIVSLDLMTFRSDSDWRRQLDGLALFDRLTGRRLRYLVNGPTTVERYADLYNSVPPRRLSITNATMAAPFSANEQDEQEHAQLAIPMSGRYGAGREIAARCKRQRATLAQARNLVQTRRTARRQIRPAA